MSLRETESWATEIWGSTLKTHQMFLIHNTPEEFRNVTISSGHFLFVSRAENPDYRQRIILMLDDRTTQFPFNILGVKFQSDCRFSIHYEAKKCLFVLRRFLNQDEIDSRFFSTTLSVTRSWFKRKYCSTQPCIYNMLDRSEKKIFQRVSKLPNYSLKELIPTVKILQESLEKL